MSNTMRGAAIRTHQNSVRSGLDVGKPVAAKVRASSDAVRTESNDANKAESLAILEQARLDAQLQHKELQIAAAVAKSTFSEAWSGERGNVAFQWVFAQPAEYWIALDALVRQAKGITQDTEDVMRKQQIDDTADALFDRILQKLTAGVER